MNIQTQMQLKKARNVSLKRVGDYGLEGDIRLEGQVFIGSSYDGGRWYGFHLLFSVELDDLGVGNHYRAQTAKTDPLAFLVENMLHNMDQDTLDEDMLRLLNFD